MKKTYLIVAAAALLTASCADDSTTGGNDFAKSAPIAFDMQTPAMLKATESGATAATKLGNEFVVWGEKNEGDGKTATSTENLVFKNYKVQYTASSAYTTTSNTKDWEYVGYTPYTNAQVYPAIADGTKQTIKYWDYSASSYTFTAVSAKQEDITNGKVKITKTETGTNGVYDKGYTIELADGATTGDIYVADRNVISKSNGTDRTATNAYGGNVTFTFRSFQTKVRFGLYERIPGYKVKVTSVKFGGTENTANFGVDGKFITAGTGTKYTVTYEDGTNNTTANRAVVAVDGTSTSTNTLTGGANIFGDGTYLGTAATAPTYDQAGGAYTAILPYPGNTTNMKLTISYDLISEDSGEKISIKDKTAEVPAAYCQWKSNYAYTYLFKITDNAADLYPITFDAVVETAEEGTQETITSETEPSITTFATSGNTVVTGNDEYKTGSTIYASVVDGGTAVTLTDATAKVYTVSSTDEANFPITAASVANAIEHASVTDAKITATAITGATIATVVPMGDGTTATRTLSAISWTAESGKTYAVEYTGTTGKKTYKIIKIAD